MSRIILLLFASVASLPAGAFHVCGMLAALVLPALSRAREATRSAACANTLKHLGLSLHMCAAEAPAGPYASFLSKIYGPPLLTLPTLPANIASRCAAINALRQE